jgi:hypothetical protein
MLFWGRRSHRFGLVTALVVLGVSLAFAASAAAEVRTGSATDPVDAGISGRLDLVAINVSYDTSAGTVAAQLTTREAPGVDPEAGLVIGLGTLEGAECIGPYALVLGLDRQPPAAAWEFAGGGAAAQMSVSGTATTLSAVGSALVGQSFNCAEAFSFVTEEEEEEEELVPVDTTAPIQLVGPPPTSPPSTPAPSNPAPTTSTTAPPPPPPAPKPNLTFPSKTVTLHRGAWKKVTVKITNIGNATAGKVSLKVGKARGVAIKPKSGTVKLKSIAAGKSKVASFKAMLTPKAKASSKLTLTVSGAKGLKVSGVVTLEAWKKPTKKKKGKGKEPPPPPPPANPPLAEKIFYGYKTEAGQSATLIGYAFIDGEWAYHGIPAEGIPNCTAVTGDGAKEGAKGCVKYSYDPTTGAVTIGSATGKLNPGGELEVDGETYSATSIPPAGTRLQVEQEYIGYYGLCGPFSTCTTWHEYLTLTNSGEFILSRSSLTTSEGAGTFVAAGSYPADQHGTYAIEKGARIALTFADGSFQTKTFAYFLNKEGNPDPAYAGILLGTDYFTFAHTE